MMKMSLIVVVCFFFLPSPFAASPASGGGSEMVDDLFNEDNNRENNNNLINNESNSEMVNTQSTPSVTAGDFVKMVFALLFVIVLIYGALRLINKRNKWFDKGRAIENIGGTTLGNNKSLQLVKVGNSILVVGVGDSINLLKEITDENESEMLLQAYKNKTETSGLSAESLIELVKKLPGNKNKDSSNKFSSLLKEQIGQLSKDRKKKIEEIDDKDGFKQ